MQQVRLAGLQGSSFRARGRFRAGADVLEVLQEEATHASPQPGAGEGAVSMQSLQYIYPRRLYSNSSARRPDFVVISEGVNVT